MAEYVSKSTLYGLCGQRGITYLHVSDIDKLPTADVAPVVHGCWIDSGVRDDDGNGEYICSRCDHKDRHSPGIRVPHCWFCGAYMEAEQEEPTNEEYDAE